MFPRKKGEVRGFPVVYRQAALVRVDSKRTRSMSFFNASTTVDVLMYAGTNSEFPIKPLQTFVFGGYDDSFRQDEIQIDFSAANGVLVVLRDDQQKEPKF